MKNSFQFFLFKMALLLFSPFPTRVLRYWSEFNSQWHYCLYFKVGKSHYDYAAYANGNSRAFGTYAENGEIGFDLSSNPFRGFRFVMLDVHRLRDNASKPCLPAPNDNPTHGIYLDIV